MVINKEEIAPGIIVYKNVIDKYDELLSDIEDSVALGVAAWSPAYVRSGGNSAVDTSKRDTLAIGIPYNLSEDLSTASLSFTTTLSQIFLHFFSPIELDYKDMFGVGTDWHEAYTLLKYGVGQKFTNHIDDHPAFHRRISTVYYMNDNYSGGEITFPRFNLTYKPKANEMLVFPSTYVYNHSVQEVTSGVRYAVVSWLR